MDAEQVVEKILADATAEAEKFKSEADEKLAHEHAELERELDEYNRQTDALAKQAAQDRRSRLLAAARMEIAKELLAEKRKLLEQVFDQAQTRLKNLPDEEYQALMTKLILQAVESGDEEVIVDNQENRIDMRFIKQVNHELAPGFKGSLKLSTEKRNIGAGFILKRGDIQNNASLKVLIDHAHQELEIQIAKELFEINA